MGDVGAPELLIILAVVLVLFGGAKLPELARSLGKAKKEFQKGVDEGMPDAEHDRPAAPPATGQVPSPPAIGMPPIDVTPRPSSEAPQPERRDPLS